MGCIFSICKKKAIQAPESEVASIQNESFTEQNQVSTATPSGHNYFEEDFRNDKYFYAMLNYQQLKSTLSQIISDNINNKLSREHADPVLEQLRQKFQLYKTQILEENRRYRKYLKEFNQQSKASDTKSEQDNNEKSGVTSAEVRTVPLTPAVERMQGGGNASSSQKNPFKSTADQIDPKQSTTEQNYENSQRNYNDLENQSSPIKFIKPQSTNEFQENGQNTITTNRKSNFDDSKNMIKDRMKGDDESSYDENQLSEMLNKNLNFTQTNVTPLNNKQRRMTERVSAIKNENNDGSDSSSYKSIKKNSEQLSHNGNQGVSSSAPFPQLKGIPQNIIRNFICEKINLIKPKQVIIDIQQAVLLTTPKGENVQVRISTNSKNFDTVELPDTELKFFQAFQINLDEGDTIFKLTFMQDQTEITQSQSFQISELQDQKIHLKNIYFKLQKSPQYAAILMIKVQYIHNLLEIQKYWSEETEARIKQIDQIRNYMTSRKQPRNSTTFQANTLNNIQTLLSNDLNSHSDDGSSYFDNQFYAK